MSANIHGHGHGRAVGAALIALLIATATASAQTSPRDRLLVTTTWLAAHLHDPGLVLLHVGEKAEYDAAHIPGARYLSLRDIDGARNGEVLELPSPADLRARLERYGISDDSRIVVYFGNDWVSPATRVVLTLEYIGLGDRTSLLDGGMRAWRRERGAVTADVPSPAAGRLTARAPRDVVVGLEWVREHAGSSAVTFVDARDASFYDGVRSGNGRAGHLPGAVSIPFSEVTDEALRIRPAAELAELFERAGVQKGVPVVAYCHIGQQATAVIFAARTLGYDARLYDGSWHEWGRRTDLPVALPGR